MAERSVLAVLPACWAAALLALASPASGAPLLASLCGGGSLPMPGPVDHHDCALACHGGDVRRRGGRA